MSFFEHFSAFQIVNNKVYYSLSTCNGLFELDLQTSRSSFISFFEKEMINVERLHLECVLWEDKIVFLPYNGRFISVFDVNQNTLEYIEVNKKTECTFFRGYIDGGRIVCIPQCLNYDSEGTRNFCVFDLHNNRIEELREIDECLRNLTQISFFSLGACESEDAIFVAQNGTNRILRIQKNEWTLSWIEIDGIESIASIDISNGCIWVTENHHTRISKVDYSGIVLEQFSDEREESGRVYRAVCNINKKTYAFPNHSNSIVRVFDGRLYPVIMEEEWKRVDTMTPYFGQILCYQGNGFLAPFGCEAFLCIFGNGEMERISIRNEIIEKKEIISEYITKGVFEFRKEGVLSLDEYLRLMMNI